MLTRRRRRRRTTVIAALCAASSLAIAGAAFAQDASPAGADGVSYQRKTVINFEDDTIEGDLKTPDGQYLEARKKTRHKSLIRIRMDFRREVLGSISDL